MVNLNEKGILISKKVVTPRDTSVTFDFDLVKGQRILYATIGISAFKFYFIWYYTPKSVSPYFHIEKVTYNEKSTTVTATLNYNALDVGSFIDLTCIIFYCKNNNNDIFLTNIAEKGKAATDNIEIQNNLSFISGIKVTDYNGLNYIKNAKYKIRAGVSYNNYTLSNTSSFLLVGTGPIYYSEETYYNNIDIGVIGGNKNTPNYLEESPQNNIINGNQEISCTFSNEISDFAFLINSISYDNTLSKGSQIYFSGFYCNFEKGKELKLLPDNKTVHGITNCFNNNSSSSLNEKNLGLNIQYTIIGVVDKHPINTSTKPLQLVTPKNEQIVSNSIVVIEEVNIFITVSLTNKNNCYYVFTSLTNTVPPTLNKIKTKSINFSYLFPIIDYYKYKDKNGFINYYIIVFYQKENSNTLFFSYEEIDIFSPDLKFNSEQTWANDINKSSLKENNNNYSISICNNYILVVYINTKNNLCYSLGLISISTDGILTISNQTDIKTNIYPSNIASNLSYNNITKSYDIALFYSDTQVSLLRIETINIEDNTNNKIIVKNTKTSLKYVDTSMKTPFISKNNNNRDIYYLSYSNNNYSQVIPRNLGINIPYFNLPNFSSGMNFCTAYYKEYLLLVYIDTTNNNLYYISKYLYEKDASISTL